MLEAELDESKQIIEASEDQIAVIDRDLVYRMTNNAYLEALGLKREEVIGRPVHEILNSELYKSTIGPNLERCFKGECVEFCMLREHRNRGVRNVRVRYLPIATRDGEVVRALVVIRDSTERIEAVKCLRESETLFRELVEGIREVIWLRDFRTDSVVYVSPACEDLFGVSAEFIMESNKGFLEVVHTEDRDLVKKSFKAVRSEGRMFDEEFRIVRPSGEVRWVWARTWPIRDMAGEPYRMVGIAEDITDRKSMEAEMRRLATVDSLTGIDNRHHFLVKASKEFARSRRYRRAMSFLMLDLDHFKEVNDTYGHHVGDEVLKAMVIAVEGELRENDLFGRLGGEEFAVVLPETGAISAVDAAERLRKIIEATNVDAGSASVTFTVSIGVAVFEEQDGDLDQVVQRSDQAMYQAKRKGRNRVVLLQAGKAAVAAR